MMLVAYRSDDLILQSAYYLKVRFLKHFPSNLACDSMYDLEAKISRAYRVTFQEPGRLPYRGRQRERPAISALLPFVINRNNSSKQIWDWTYPPLSKVACSLGLK